VVGVTVSIRGEDGEPLPAGMEGEIWISSPAMTTCYDGLVELSQECFVEGWFFAGDLGHVDEEGYLFITGRKKLLFIVAGNKVDPLEVEDIIRGCNKVDDVVVVGVDHVDYGQMIKAFVVPVAGVDCTEADIINYAKIGLAEYKIPKRVEFIAEIPRSPLGKVLRKYLQ
jgi:long-chain acyl-CoA synthetase